MSIMCCVYVPEGIVMAADSRLTRTKPGKAFELPLTEGQPKTVIVPQTTYTSSDNTQKVLLIHKVGVGVSFCGNAIIDGATVADYIRRFEIEKVVDTDTTEVVAHKLADYYRKTETHFFVCGYNDDIPYVYDVYGTVVKRSNVSEPIPENAKSKDVAADDNPPEVGTPENIKETIIDEKSDRFVEPMITYGALWAGQKTAITKIVNNPPILNADWGTMPLTDAIDFSEFLVDTTIKYERFCDDIQTCGGDIDILVITKDDAFWKQHKIYNPIKK